VVYESCWIFIEKSIFSFKYAVSSPSLFLIDPIFFCGGESFSLSWSACRRWVELVFSSCYFRFVPHQLLSLVCRARPGSSDIFAAAKFFAHLAFGCIFRSELFAVRGLQFSPPACSPRSGFTRLAMFSSFHFGSWFTVS
jgi:hypothetical protein